ncbi:LPXTG cell wall anchor domain-containing protein [Isoptericola aurantiacus]|uniref:LPXTG cell wall anchor domain-containing protein n=1 Tax=Isoptericola aurantiacus TaxID=3377839 RepID=UPI003839EBF9
MKRILASTATAALALGGLAVAVAAPASAHTPKVNATCEALTVDLDSYRGATVTVTIDEVEVAAEEFQDAWDGEFAFDPASEAHDWSVDVDAWDDEYYDWDDAGTTTPCVEEPEQPEETLSTAFYVYPKRDAAKPAAWENSGEQTLITTRAGGEFWEELPEEYPGEFFDEADLPADACDAWGVQQDIVRLDLDSIRSGFVHITYPTGPLFGDRLEADRHDDLSTYLPECDEDEQELVTLPAPSSVEECDVENSVILPESEHAEYTEEWNEAGTQVTVTATPHEGVHLAEDAVTSWTFDFTDAACDAEPTVVQPEAPEVVDLCGVENDDVTVPESTEEITYSSTDDGILATAGEGFTLGDLPEGYQSVDESSALFPVSEQSFTDAECALVPGDIAAVCESAVPYLAYEVSLPEGVEVDDENPLTVTFLNPNGENHVTSGLPLSGSLLWPGASATEPLQWPGWELLEDGTYAETDGNFAWTREGVEVLFEVNPDYSTVVEYPEASETCANPPAGEAEQVVAVEPSDEPSAEPSAEVAAAQSELPRTGATVGVAAGAALLLVAGGVALFLVRRRFQRN